MKIILLLVVAAITTITNVSNADVPNPPVRELPPLPNDYMFTAKITYRVVYTDNNGGVVSFIGTRDISQPTMALCNDRYNQAVWSIGLGNIVSVSHCR